MAIGTTYAFKDLTGSLTNETFGTSFLITGGNIGNGNITISMATDRSAHDVGADGTVMGSYISGNNGTVAIEVQQTSTLHHELLDLYNRCVTAAENSDVSGWMDTTISFRTMLDGSQHILSGCSFTKIPDKSYQANAQKLTWTLMAADIVNV